MVIVIQFTAAAAYAAASSDATYVVSIDEHGQTTIKVSGQGAIVSLPQVRNGLGAAGRLLEDHGNGIWQLNANLRVERDVTINLSSSTGVSQLRLRSQGTSISAAASNDQINYQSFAYLRTDDGTINIDGIKIYSWDPDAGMVDIDITNGRSYILAKYAAHLNINNAELSYLGSADGESYGVAWRDINDSAGRMRTRVTGQVLNSQFHHNYYGVYTFQASGMLFRGNKFFRNLHYGFDPHDYSTHFIVEENESFDNGSHGFIISRGCTNFVFRHNKSYNNLDPDPLKLAHGFMLDPGSPNSADPQAPSTNNLLEDNQAYRNEGYGLRILGSADNIVRGNVFQNNQQGLTVEQGSPRNILTGNVLSSNRINGVFVRGGADTTTITGNTAIGNATNGIYIKSNGNTVSQNTVRENSGAGIMLLPETSSASAVADLTPVGQPLRVAQVDSDLLGTVVAESVIAGNRISDNTVVANANDGIELKAATNTRIEANSIERNGAHGIYVTDGASNNRISNNILNFNRGNGIRVNGIATLKNSWSENLVYSNFAGGILVTSGANSGLRPPVISHLQARQVSGIAAPGAVVELFSDTGRQGRYFEARTTAQADGSFTFSAPNGWRAPNLNAIATDASGNSSAFVYAGAWVVHLPVAIR
jgi:parallel beta-helix repeat protein